MPNRLTNLLVNRVALVDRGANPEAHMLMWKRDFSADQRQSLADKGQAMSDGSYPIVTKADLKNAIQSFGRGGGKASVKAHIVSRAKALGATDMLPDTWTVSKVGRKISSARMQELKAMQERLGKVIADAEVEPAEKGGTHMPEFKKEDLPEEAQKFVETIEAAKQAAEEKATELEKRVTDLEKSKSDEGKDEDPVVKAMSTLDPAVREVVEKSQRDATEAIAKARQLEVEKRDREYTDIAKGFGPLTVKAEEFGPVLRKVADDHAEEASEIVRVLQSAAEAVKHANILKAQGADASDDEGSAIAKLNAKAAEIRKSDSQLTKEQAFTKASEENPDLVQEYRQEIGVAR